jgi:hypothetical protein
MSEMISLEEVVCNEKEINDILDVLKKEKQYVVFDNGDGRIHLDGEFTWSELKALIIVSRELYFFGGKKNG